MENNNDQNNNENNVYNDHKNDSNTNNVVKNVRNGKDFRVTSIEEASHFLLDHNVNSIDAEGLTPLLHTIILGNLEVVKYIIDRGACVHYQDRAGWSPLLWSIRCNHVDIAKYLIKDISVDVNMADYSGRTPLMCAICGYHTEIAKMLIYRGADIHMEDNNKENALSLSTKAVMSKRGGRNGKRVVHQDCDCEKCTSHHIIANLLMQRGAGDPFTGSYASQKIKNLNIFSRLLNCINLDDNAESWCMPDAAIPEISPTLSFLTTSHPTGRDGNNDKNNRTTTDTDYYTQRTSATKPRTKSADSTMTKNSNSSNTTADETATENDDDDDDITTNSERIVGSNWSLSFESDIDEKENRHEQEEFLQKMRRQHTFYGEDDDFYSGGRKFY